MTVILLRHGRSTSNTAHTLAGRTDGIDLDDKGREQAQAVVERLAGLPIRAIVRSPLLRCRRTVEPLAAALGLDPLIDERISEVDYGSWTGRKIGPLQGTPVGGGATAAQRGRLPLWRRAGVRAVARGGGGA